MTEKQNIDPDFTALGVGPEWDFDERPHWDSIRDQVQQYLKYLPPSDRPEKLIVQVLPGQTVQDLGLKVDRATPDPTGSPDERVYELIPSLLADGCVHVEIQEADR